MQTKKNCERLTVRGMGGGLNAYCQPDRKILDHNNSFLKFWIYHLKMVTSGKLLKKLCGLWFPASSHFFRLCGTAGQDDLLVWVDGAPGAEVSSPALLHHPAQHHHHLNRCYHQETLFTTIFLKVDTLTYGVHIIRRWIWNWICQWGKPHSKVTFSCWHFC